MCEAYWNVKLVRGFGRELLRNMPTKSGRPMPDIYYNIENATPDYTDQFSLSHRWALKV